MKGGGISFGARCGFLGLLALLCCVACEEPEKPTKKALPAAEVDAPEPEPPPPPPTPPTFSIDELGPKVRYSRAVITDESGQPRVQGIEQLRKDLEAEKAYISGKDILLSVGRKASPTWVSTYLTELASFAPSGVRIATETRDEYPKEVPFSLERTIGTVPPCTLVGAILADRSTAIWKVAGGTAHKRGRGMGGPDLTMTGDTIVSLAKGCDSPLFVVSGAEGVEWGLIYDLAASGMILEKAPLERALFPQERPTAGRPVKLGS
jgi:hypothetical protein